MNILDKYSNMLFFDADAGGGEGGGGGAEGVTPLGTEAFAPSPKITTQENQLPSEKAGGGDGDVSAQVGPEQEPKPGGFDAKALATEFGAVIGQHLKPLQESITKSQEPQLTPEEARAMLKVWSPDDAWYAEYDNLDTRRSAVEKMRDALIVQADTLSQFRLNELREVIMGEIGPMLHNVTQMADSQREDRFRGSYPQLAAPELAPLITAVAQQMVGEGKRFTNENDMFKALASGVEAVIKVNNPTFKLTAGSSPAGRNNNQIPVTSPGSGGGSGKREGTGGKPASRGLAVFQK